LANETEILETFRFDFTYLDRDTKSLCDLFDKYGYPNLCIDTQDSYDGFWKVYNKRTGETIWSGYHSGFITFFIENGLVKIAFDYKTGVENHPFLNSKTFVYFENVQKIKTQKDKKLESLEAEVMWLKSELAKYKRKVAFLEESSGEI